MTLNPNTPFRDSSAAQLIAKEIAAQADKDCTYKIMEICGTHTMAIARCGIRSILPENVKLISGPGCPVCVTAQGDIDLFFDLINKGISVLTFGDLLKIPGSNGESLLSARANGADVRAIYSPLDAISIAAKEVDKKFVFLGVGFETTAPTIAALAKTVREKKLQNLFILSLCKTMPEAIHMVLSDKDLALSGFLCPGHVTVVTGLSLYNEMASCSKAAVVAGFEPVEVLGAVLEIIKKVNSRDFKIVNMYKRVVQNDGNALARKIMAEVFDEVDAVWRGLGNLRRSGLDFNQEYDFLNAKKVFGLKPKETVEIKGCKCGMVLTGKIRPDECPLFGKVCTSESPVGPCMASSEGSCAAYWRFKNA